MFDQMMPETQITHISQFRNMAVKIHPEADMMFREDPRFHECLEMEQIFMLALIGKICGNEYSVLNCAWINEKPYYYILVDPKFAIMAPDGQPQIISAARVPCEYAEITSKGFWAAR